MGRRKSPKPDLKRASRANQKVLAFNRTIGKKIARLSKERGANTISLGKAIGISQAQVSRLQNGLQGFRSGTLFKIAKALNVDPKELLP